LEKTEPRNSLQKRAYGTEQSATYASWVPGVRGFGPPRRDVGPTSLPGVALHPHVTFAPLAADGHVAIL